jgi:hypothetical protein
MKDSLIDIFLLSCVCELSKKQNCTWQSEIGRITIQGKLRISKVTRANKMN